MSGITITGLFVYPIKSCGPVELHSATLDQCGLTYDRRYMLVDEQGAFITARAVPQLLQVELALEPSSDTEIVASHSKMPTALRLSRGGPVATDAGLIEVSIWRDRPSALVSQHGSDWFSTYLGRSVRLVFLPNEHLRQIDPSFAQPGEFVSFADGYPMLLTNEASLADLNSRLPTPIGMDRFRPNVVVSGANQFAEDTWAELTLDGISCVAPKLCDRCVMTTVDPATAEKSREPLKTLASYRRWNGAVWFGTNVIAHGAGVLHRGAPVHVLSERPHPNES